MGPASIRSRKLCHPLQKPDKPNRSRVQVKQKHKVISFRQEPWLTPYTDVNTKQRAEARNEFEKSLFKIMNNSVFGKRIENALKYMDMKLTAKEHMAIKSVSKNVQGRSMY